MYNIQNILKNRVLLSSLLAITGIVLCFQNLVFYIRPNTSVYVFLAIAPFLFTIRTGERGLRYAWTSMAFVVLYFFLKMQLLYFLAFASFLLFILESNLGKVNALPLFIILLISPYSSFIFNVFGFPTRLFLTEQAAYFLSFFNEDVTCSGNNILIHNQSFSVDAACMGLTMVGYGFASTLLFIHSFERKFSKRLKFYSVLTILMLSAAFIVLSNLFRIVLIVLVQSKPETASHEIIGLLCFLVYCLAPMYFISKWIIQYSPTYLEKTKVKSTPNAKLIVILSLVLISSLAYFNFNRGQYRNIQLDSKSNQIVLEGFTKSLTKEKVIQFENEQALIYIKPSCSFFAPDHSPTICWKGNGYEFKNIQTSKVENNLIYTAELVKDDDILQTAWWFDNGKEKTISQLDWRWKTACGEEPFRLVNITSYSKEVLEEQILEMMDRDLFGGLDKKSKS